MEKRRCHIDNMSTRPHSLCIVPVYKYLHVLFVTMRMYYVTYSYCCLSLCTRRQLHFNDFSLNGLHLSSATLVAYCLDTLNLKIRSLILSCITHYYIICPAELFLKRHLNKKKKQKRFRLNVIFTYKAINAITYACYSGE